MATPKTITKRSEYIDKLTNQLKKWDKDLVEFETQREKRKDKVKAEVTKHIHKLRTQHSEMKQKMNRFKEAGDAASKSIKQDLEKLHKDIEKGFDRVRKELKK